MKKIMATAAGLIILELLVVGAAVVRPSKTGDRDLDSLLGQINENAKADPDDFFRQLSRQHNIPEEEIRLEKERHGFSYGDTYMAAALSRISKRPIGAIAEDYKQGQGKGWGVTAMSLGIKPGSTEFQQMKADARGAVDHMNTVAKERKHQQKLEKERAREQARKTRGKDKK